MDVEPDFITSLLHFEAFDLLNKSLLLTYDFLAGSKDDSLLVKAALAKMIAIEKEIGSEEEYTDAVKKNGIVLPYAALKALVETLDEGANKYGIHNWILGMQISSVLLNHGIRHIFLYQMGDRSENHLGHSLWGDMTSIHMFNTREDMRIELMTEKYTLTPEILEENAKVRSRYHANDHGIGSSDGGDLLLHSNKDSSRLVDGAT